MLQISIVIPTLNRFKILKRVLKTLDQQNFSKKHFEVIVINDGSTDPDYEHFVDLKHDFPDLQLILETGQRHGAAAARNLGISYAKAPYVLFLGDDMLVHPNLLQEHLKTHEQFPDDTVLGFVEWDPDMPLNDVMRFIAPYGPQFNYTIKDPYNCGFGMFVTCNLSVPRKLLEIDQFSTDFRECNCEDTDLGYRLEKKGMKVIYNPDAITYHHHYHDETTFIKRQQQAGRNLKVFVQRNPEFMPHYVPRQIRKRQIIYSLKRLFAKWRKDKQKYYHYTFELAWMQTYLAKN